MGVLNSPSIFLLTIICVLEICITFTWEFEDLAIKGLRLKDIRALAPKCGILESRRATVASAAVTEGNTLFTCLLKVDTLQSGQGRQGMVFLKFVCLGATLVFRLLLLLHSRITLLTVLER